jgi:hypothetical protein
MTLSAGVGRRAETAGRKPELLRPAGEAACGERERDEGGEERGDESEYDCSDELTGGEDEEASDDDEASDEGDDDEADAPCNGAGDSST